MKRPRITREVLSGLQQLAAVAGLAQTHALRRDVQAALRWVGKATEADQAGRAAK